MSVIGFDIGSNKSVIAVARNRGIDIIVNEVSNRFTPTMVGFGEKQRYLGEAAKTHLVTNYKNTIPSVNLLVGRTIDDQELNEIERPLMLHDLCDIVAYEDKKEVAVTVMYQGEKKVFTAIQLMAMYLSHLKQIAERELKTVVCDCVISVPVFFTDAQRRAMSDASEVAGLKCLRLMNDISAAALNYGIYQTQLGEQDSKIVAVVDIGHSSCTVALIHFVAGKLTMRSVAFDRHLGGRDFEECLVQHCAKEFKKKYKIDLYSNPKALLRMRLAAERLKKVLSANPEGVLNVESLMNDIDVNQHVTRVEFEEMIQPLLDRLEPCLQQCLESSGLKREEIMEIKMIGGGTRVPAIKERLAKFFGKEPDTTLNQDESAARGCALQCAIFSPVFKVRDYTIVDITSYPIRVSWEPMSSDAMDNDAEVFAAGAAIPSTKLITFYRKADFDLHASYGQTNLLAPGVSRSIGTFSVKKVKPLPNGEDLKIKVKVRLNHHGIFSVESAQAIEEEFVEEPMELEDGKKSSAQNEVINDREAKNQTQATPMDTETTSTEAKDVKKKKLSKKIDLPVESHTCSLSTKTINHLRELELEMMVNDKVVAETAEKKNAVEECVYDLRGKLEGTYVDFVKESDKELLLKLLNDTETWLYEDGDDALKSAYSKKLEELYKLRDPIVDRYREHEERPKAAEQLQLVGIRFRDQAHSTDDRYSHINQSERDRVLAECEKKEQWLNKEMQAQDALPKHQTPRLRAAAIRAERDSLLSFCTPILTRPKPKEEPKEEPKEQPKEDATPTTMHDESANIDNDSSNNIESHFEGVQGKEGLIMDVD